MSTRRAWDPERIIRLEAEVASLRNELSRTSAEHEKPQVQMRITVIETVLPVVRQMKRLMSTINRTAER